VPSSNAGDEMEPLKHLLKFDTELIVYIDDRLDEGHTVILKKDEDGRIQIEWIVKTP
jgi:hypothetical protein